MQVALVPTVEKRWIDMTEAQRCSVEERAHATTSSVYSISSLKQVLRAPPLNIVSSISQAKLIPNMEESEVDGPLARRFCQGPGSLGSLCLSPDVKQTVPRTDGERPKSSRIFGIEPASLQYPFRVPEPFDRGRERAVTVA